MSDLQKIRIMIVSPKGYGRNLLREIFFSLGVRDITLAANCSAAIGALRARRCNAVFCDEIAGDIAGFMKALRRDTKTKNITVPAFLVSARVQEKQVAIARDAGMNSVLVKPLSAATIERRLKLVLERPKAWVATNTFIGPDRRANRGGRSVASQRLGPFNRRAGSDGITNVFPVVPALPFSGIGGIRDESLARRDTCPNAQDLPGGSSICRDSRQVVWL